MSFSPRFFVFVITLGFLVGIGIIAGLKIAITESKQSSQSTPLELTDATPVTEGEKMIADEPFITALSATSTSDASLGQSVPLPTKKKDTMTALSYIVGNVETGKVYLSLNQNRVLPVASMSKLITAIVATNTISPTTTIEITPLETNVASDTSMIAAGEKFELKEMLYPLLLNSSNVAAEAIASSTDRDHFLELMSSSAWEVNMPTAFFADPSGLDPRNNASAKDMFALAQYLYQFRPDILAITDTPHIAVATTSDHGSHSFDSIHPFIMDPRFIGGKTGRTFEAGETMLTILRIGNEPIAFIVLHSSFGARAADTNLLIKRFLAL